MTAPSLEAPGESAWNGLVPEDVEHMLACIGIAAPLGEEFGCVLPSYEGTPSSRIDPSSLRYERLYEAPAKTWWSLAEVYASTIARRLVDLTSGPAHGRWWTRLRHESGLIEVDVPILDLPAQLSPTATRVAQGFALAWALNEARHPGAPVAFACRFAAAWCGLSDHRLAATAMRELLRSGVLVVQDYLPTRPQPTPLYAPAAEVSPYVNDLEAISCP